MFLSHTQLIIRAGAATYYTNVYITYMSDNHEPP